MAEPTSEPPDELDRLIADARQARPDATTEARIAAGVARAVGVAAVPTGPDGRSLVAGAAKLTIAAAMLGGALWWALRPGRMPNAPESSTTVSVRAPIAEPPPVEEAAPSPPVASAPPIMARPVARRTVPNRTAEARRLAQPAETQPSEWQLVRQAREALDGDPGASLRLTVDHARLYPRGTLAQEREVIAVDALVRLGRRDEANARAEALLRRFPETAHRSHLEAILARTK